MRVYSLDLETTSRPDNGGAVEAFLCGVCEVYDTTTFFYTDNIPDLLRHMLHQGGIYYVHYLRFDYSFIYPYLHHYGLSIDEFITGENHYVRRVVVADSDGQSFELRDSYSLFARPLSDVFAAWNKDFTHKHEVEYYTTRPEYVSDEFFAYFRADVCGLAEALSYRLPLGCDKLTTSSDSKTILERVINERFATPRTKKPFQSWFFPSLSRELDKDLRPWYRGGFCFTPADKAGKMISEGVTIYDRNSQYPDIMKRAPLPYGQPFKFDGEPPEADLFLVRIVIDWCHIKDGYTPFIINNSRNVYMSYDYISEISEYDSLKSRTLYLTNAELELFKEAYNYGKIYYDGGYWFKSKRGIMSEYIDLYNAMKEEGTGLRQFAKDMLNAPSGKFGQKAEGLLSRSVMVGGIQRFKELPPDEDARPFYIPMSIFITATGRCELLRQIHRVGDDFLYCDTDSIHCTGSHDDKFNIDPVSLGAWKVEARPERAIYLRAKRYAYEEGGTPRYVCAGINEHDIARALPSIDYFRFGAAIPVTRAYMGRGGMSFIDMSVSI